MPFFQNSVLNKHLKALDLKTVDATYEKFVAYFHNSAIQKNIRDAREEQFQEGFLRELFVNILGYKLNPQPDYNLTTELKNERGAKKVDGAIIKDNKALGVIELKGTDTKDLDKINEQAFNYKNNQSGCVYVITSNFEKLRLFIHDSVNYEEFNLFTLTRERFRLLWLCLAAENILDGLPLKVKEESLLEEEKITKQLYKDYAGFRTDLWQNMVKNNPQLDKLLLFKKTQKLLDRFLFIFFAEDSGLLPPNFISSIIVRWEILKREDAYKPLYDIFKQHFVYIDSGRKGQKTIDDIFAYNGGLFKSDELLNSIILDDEIVLPHVTKLTNYDFQSEVDVNILGHIFENSLNEIEIITAELDGQEIGKGNTKRKKAGVFYTPKYITKYIVDNTVGKICEEKKIEFGVIDEEFAKGRRNRKKETIKKLDSSIKAYRNWLLNISICDPACGSGAFLNQALEFLIEEHIYIDELQAQLFGASIVFKDVSDHILEKNLYGVDINEEGIEIAKLSLWLRTAQRGRKLTKLNNNIKCGNSLVEDPKVAGEKAFNWVQEFPTVFNNGGFDVIIGNPPYVFGGNEGIRYDEKKYFKENYITGSGKVNLFTLFIEKSHKILKDRGEFSFIIPNTFLRVTSYHTSRKYFVENFRFRELADLGNDVFQEAITTAIILIAKKDKPHPDDRLRIIKDFKGEYSEFERSDIIANNYIITSNISKKKLSVLKKLKKSSILLGEECKEMIFGVVITKNKGELVSETELYGYKPFLEGKDIGAYFIKPIHNYLNYNKDNLHRARTPEIFETKEKLLVQRITGGSKPLKVAYDNFGYYNKESINNIILKEDSVFHTKTILCLLNSSLINWFYSNQFTNESTLTVNISKEYLSQIPIKIPENQELFIDLADNMLQVKEEYQQLKTTFLRLVKNKYFIEIPSKKLQSWDELEFSIFLKELKKVKVHLSLSEEAEWMQYFKEQKQNAQVLKSEINRVDAEIDQMVYHLYGLNDEEIKIVEGN